MLDLQQESPQGCKACADLVCMCLIVQCSRYLFLYFHEDEHNRIAGVPMKLFNDRSAATELQQKKNKIKFFYIIASIFYTE